MDFQIANHFPNDILFEQEGPFISLYLPTNRHAPGNKKDAIVYKNLLTTVENSLAQKYSTQDIDTIMQPLQQIQTNSPLWNHTLDGLAILCSTKQCIVYNLHDAVEPLAIVADHFHTKPLIKAFQSTDQYLLLGLNSNTFELYQGNQYGIEPLVLEPGTPHDIEAILGDQLTESYLTQGSYNGPGKSAMYHGHGGAKPEIDKDTEKFFRYIDRFVTEKYSKPLKLPLILVALKEHHPTFANISDNPYLLAVGIKGEYTSFTLEELRQKTWEILEPIYMAELQAYANRFEQANAAGTGSDSLSVVSKAIMENRVETLLLDANVIVPGKVLLDTGKILDRNLADPDIGDVLDALAQQALKGKSEVVVLPSAIMPGKTGIAAIFRY